jgi:hypothetical protein
MLLHPLVDAGDEVSTSILWQLLDAGLRRKIGCVAVCSERDLEQSARDRRFLEHSGRPYGRCKVQDEIRVRPISTTIDPGASDASRSASSNTSSGATGRERS